MSVQVPLQPVAFQTLSVVLAGQNSQIRVYQKAGVVYFDLALDGQPIVTTKACRNRIRLLLASSYEPYTGDFVFVDTQGDTQPEYAGLGTRYILLYLTADEIAI
jgi:hypothetical protein